MTRRPGLRGRRPHDERPAGHARDADEARDAAVRDVPRRVDEERVSPVSKPNVAYTPPKADSALNLNDWSLS